MPSLAPDTSHEPRHEDKVAALGFSVPPAIRWWSWSGGPGKLRCFGRISLFKFFRIGPKFVRLVSEPGGVAEMVSPPKSSSSATILSMRAARWDRGVVPRGHLSQDRGACANARHPRPSGTCPYGRAPCSFISAGSRAVHILEVHLAD